MTCHNLIFNKLHNLGSNYLYSLAHFIFMYPLFVDPLKLWFLFRIIPIIRIMWILLIYLILFRSKAHHYCLFLVLCVKIERPKQSAAFLIEIWVFFCPNNELGDHFTIGVFDISLVAFRVRQLHIWVWTVTNHGSSL